MQRWANCFLISSLTVFFLCIEACNAPKQTTSSTPAVDISTVEKPRNVIFLIGDGMGLPQITGAMYMNGNKTVFERFKNIGFQKTQSHDNLVTDSAAGATAFASGVKTYNGAIGVNPQKKPVPTILELAENKGMATGLVVTIFYYSCYARCIHCPCT
jgi:alkaline phosphatase